MPLRTSLAALILVALSSGAAHADLPAAVDALRGAPPAHPARFEFAVVPRGMAADTEPWDALGVDFVLDADTPGGALAPPRIALFPGDPGAPPAFAFSHGNTRIVVLATGDGDAAPDPARVAWLRADLEESTAANVVLVVDRPGFAGNWARDWAPIAELVVAHPVRWVVALDAPDAPTRDFGVHDGARHLALGGGDGRFLFARVRGDELHGALVAAGGAVPLDARRDDRLEAMARLRDAFACGVVEAPLGAPMDASFTVSLRNPGVDPLGGVLRWHTPPGWRVDPAEAVYAAAPGEEALLRFRAVVASPDSARFPVPAFTTALPGPAGDVPVRVPLAFQPTLAAARALQPVTLDGRLDDWAAVPPHRLTYAQGYSVFDTDDLVAWVRAQWTPEAILVAVELRDDAFAPADGPDPRDGDHVRIRLGKVEWLLALGAAGPHATRIPAGAAFPEAVPDLPLAILRDGPRRVYEVAFPAAAPLEPGHRHAFGVQVHDHDPAQPQHTPHHASLSPTQTADAPETVVLILVD